MKLALVQMEIKERNCAGNTAHGLTLLEEAAKQSDLVILPEIWTTGYSLGHLKEEAVTLDSPLLETLRGIARKYQCSLLPGSLPVLKNGLVYNMIPAINKDGKIVHQYGKAHLFGMFEEEKFFPRGMLLMCLTWMASAVVPRFVMICVFRNFTVTLPCRERN